jgi:hypothetical protein
VRTWTSAQRSVSHPTDEDLSAGAPGSHPTDEDLSAGAPGLGTGATIWPLLNRAALVLVHWKVPLFAGERRRSPYGIDYYSGNSV